MTDEKHHTYPGGDGICLTVVHAAVFKMHEQQGPAVQHRELCSKPEWERGLEENGYVHVRG